MTIGTVEKIGEGIYSIKMKDGENRFNPKMVDFLHSALDTVQKNKDLQVLIFTGEGKFFSNGLDLEYFTKNIHVFQSTINEIWRLLARILVMGCYTISAFNGHAFGAGLFLGLACDFRFMRNDKGFLCFPEVNLGLPLRSGFESLAQTKLSRNALRTGVLTGKKWTAVEALKEGMIDAIVDVKENSNSDDVVVHHATKFAKTLLNKSVDPSNLSNLKHELYGAAFAKLMAGDTEASIPASLSSRL